MKILLVEDSATVAAYVASILGTEPDMELVGVAGNAEDGVRMTRQHKPNVVLMDMQLPDHDGVWAIERIMSENPVPIVVLSGQLRSRERDLSFESLRAGAVDVMAKPTGLSSEARASFRDSLVSTLRLMCSAVVVRRRKAKESPWPTEITGTHGVSADALASRRFVLIGASTGGPELIYRLLAGLPAPLPYAVLITQHTLDGFDESLASWLACSGHPVKLAREGGEFLPGSVTLAPADRHVRVDFGRLALVSGKRGESISSIDTMFDSAARTWGAECLGVLLSGMGRDGSEGMRTLHQRGALTVAQSADSCVVSSMPDSARARGAVRYVLNPDEILGLLRDLARAHIALDPARKGAEPAKPKVPQGPPNPRKHSDREDW
jgi:two-component system, chemotaxis family, protein-glutamate methylesterase/glutaminase